LELTESSEQYIIQYQDQSGPIKLLLELVQTKKADIYQVSMNEIIGGFVDFINRHQGVAIDILSGFIYTASVLLEIKSRSLLPSKNTENQKQQEISEEILKLREREYRIFKKLSAYLEKSLETEELFFVREAPVEKEFLDIMPNFLEGINKNDLATIARNLFRGDPVQLGLDIAYNHRNIRSIYDEMERINTRLEEKEEITFKQLTMEFDQVLDIIICFLSILELYKNEQVEIIQFENFGNIIIKKINKDEPKNQ